jgi:hypothetical protein
MKFDYYSGENFEYKFNFTLTENEIRKHFHKHGLTYRFGSNLFPPNTLEYYKILHSLEMIRENIDDNNIDLGIDYKRKYDELVELLEPHKIDNMPPETTLKMLLKYSK